MKRETAYISGFPGTIREARVSEDGRWVACRLWKGAMLFRLGDGRPSEVRLEGAAPATTATGSTANAMAFSSDGEHLAVAEEKLVTVWETSTGRKVATVYGREAELAGVAIVSGGRRILAIDVRGRLHVWDASRSLLLGSLTLADDVHRATLDLSPDGRRLLVSLALGGKTVNMVRMIDLYDCGACHF